MEHLTSDVGWPQLFAEVECPHLLEHNASLIAQLVNHLPAMQETWVRFLGLEDPLEKEMAIHSSILAWKIPWKGSLAGYSPCVARVRHDLAT